jgi:hypothetical protein
MQERRKIFDGGYYEVSDGFALLFYPFKSWRLNTEAGRRIHQPILKYNILPNIEKGSCCAILKSHHELLKGDPERLSTDFIKKLSQCDCDIV